jgi:transcription initiation factor TFIID subunit 1, fungi type
VLVTYGGSQDREKADVSIPLSLHDRSFDLVLLSNWEDQIIYEADADIAPSSNNQNNLTTPLNKSLDEGSWTQSIIWSPRAPFRDFTQLELNEEDVLQEERHPGMCHRHASNMSINPGIVDTRPKKRLRLDNAHARDKFNLSNDQFYEVAKEGGRHRVRQTFGQLVVEHAYPAQKLQLPFVRSSFHVIKPIGADTIVYLVQDTIIQAGSSIFPPPRLTVSDQY